MDSIVQKLIFSRRKSIVAVRERISQLETVQRGAKTPEMKKGVEDVLYVHRRRLAKLERELEAFERSDGQARLGDKK